jgi:2-keto-4-pentenoate hydratase
MAAIELIEDLRYDYKRLDAAAMVAGNGWNAGVVLRRPMTDWAALDLAQLTARSRSTDAKSARARAAM